MTVALILPQLNLKKVENENRLAAENIDLENDRVNKFHMRKHSEFV
jgi:hypothetical protein